LGTKFPIKMCRRSEVITIALFAVVLGFVSCNSFEERVLGFPISTSATIPKESVPVIPAQLSEYEFSMDEFQVYDSVAVAYRSVKNYFFTALSLNSGDTLAHLCRFGRGDGETFTISPYYDIVNGIAGLVEPSRSRYYEVDIPESIRIGQTAFNRVVNLSTDTHTFYNVSPVGNDSLLIYDAKYNTRTRTLDGVPGFSMFDLKDGSLIAEYHIARDASIHLSKRSPYTISILYRSVNCLIPENHCLCLAFKSFPLVAFLDYKNGTIRGVKINGAPEFNQMKRINYFSDVEYVGGTIYLLYLGFSYDNHSPEMHSMILEMDLSGKIERCYDLGDVYYRMEYGNGRFYLSKFDDNHFYVIDLQTLSEM